MQPFTQLAGRAAPLAIANVDTDVIIRIDRLTGSDWSQIGRYALESLRYHPDGSEVEGFVLNRPEFRGAAILIAGTNFGCGSSREPAVNALLAMGVRCIVADSFGDIFYANCFQNGLLPIRVAGDVVASMMASAAAGQGMTHVDLQAQTVTMPDGQAHPFEIDQTRKAMLLEGLDEIGLTLKEADAIAAWQADDRRARPWVWLARSLPAPDAGASAGPVNTETDLIGAVTHA